jgi:hypothetical protein
MAFVSLISDILYFFGFSFFDIFTFLYNFFKFVVHIWQIMMKSKKIDVNLKIKIEKRIMCIPYSVPVFNTLRLGIM